MPKYPVISPMVHSESVRGSDWRVRAAAWTMVCVAVGAPLLLGGATTSTRAVILLLVLLASTAALTVSWTERRALGDAPWVGWGAMFAIAWTAIQAAPLPCGWVDSVWTEREWLSGALRAAGINGVPRCTLSRAPGATWAAAALGASLSTVMLASIALARLGQRRLLRASVMWSALTLALVAVCHTIVDAKSVFGVFVPQHARPGLLLAPLLNGNHCAALLALGVPLTIAQFQDSEKVEQRILWAGAGAALLTCITLTLSRGGIIATGVSVALYAHLLRAKPGNERSRTMDNSANPRTIAFIALGFAAVLIVSADLIAGEFFDTSSAHEKLQVVSTYFELVRRHPWLGVGRSAFGDVSVLVDSGVARADYAESLPVHWMIEWGIPASVIIALSIERSLPWRRIEGRATKALLAALGGLLVHDLADFALEMPGVAVPAAIAFGTLIGSASGRSARRASGTLRPLFSVQLGIFGLLLVTTWPLQTTESRVSARTEVATLLASSSPAFDAKLTSALERYPLDPILYVNAAAHAVRAQASTAAHWLNLAMTITPRWASPHIQAAYWLETRGRVIQAAGELAAALELDPRASATASCDFLKRHPSVRLAWSMAPPNSDTAGPIEDLAHCVMQANNPDVGANLYAEILEKYPNSLVSQERLVRVSIARGQPAEGVLLARRLQLQAPNFAAGISALIDALRAKNDFVEAQNVYKTASSAVRANRYVILSAMPALAATRDRVALTEAVDALLAQARGAADDTALSRVAAETLAGSGLSGKAISVLQALYRRHREPSHLERAYELARDSGLRDAALHMALELCHVRHRDSLFCGSVGPKNGQ